MAYGGCAERMTFDHFSPKYTTIRPIQIHHLVFTCHFVWTKPFISRKCKDCRRIHDNAISTHDKFDIFRPQQLNLALHFARVRISPSMVTTKSPILCHDAVARNQVGHVHGTVYVRVRFGVFAQKLPDNAGSTRASKCSRNLAIRRDTAVRDLLAQRVDLISCYHDTKVDKRSLCKNKYNLN